LSFFAVLCILLYQENEKIVEQRYGQLNDAKERTEAKIQELFARSK